LRETSPRFAGERGISQSNAAMWRRGASRALAVPATKRSETGLFREDIKTMNGPFVRQYGTFITPGKQLVKALPKMADKDQRQGAEAGFPDPS
jgi:hypothetical protein